MHKRDNICPAVVCRWGFHRRTERSLENENLAGIASSGGYMTGDNPRETITVYEVSARCRGWQGPILL